MKNLYLLFFLIAPIAAKANLKANPPQGEAWHLQSFLYMVEKHPKRLLNLGEKLFSDEHLLESRKSPALAGEWRHRAAMLSSLSQFFHPQTASAKNKENQKRATQILKKALLEDPSLLVRDAAVDSIGRINRMHPGITQHWKGSLEAAFLDKKNIVQDEGLFIRESILRLFKESGLRPTKKIRLAAKKDQNQAVRYMLNDWKTSTFESLEN